MQERAGLHRLHGDDEFFLARRHGAEPALGGEIEHLPAGHAAETRAARKLAHQRDPHRRIGMGFLARENVEGKGEQRVAGEDRGRIVIGTMQRRTAATQIVVVHRRQVVMDQRIAMHAFERGAGHQPALTRHVEQGRALHDQKRTQPLAAAEARIAHRVQQALRALDFALNGL